MSSLTIPTTEKKTSRLGKGCLIIGSVLFGSIVTFAMMKYLPDFGQVASTVAAEKKERVVLFWYDPMMPNTKFDQPGKSPFMDMDLVPKYADEAPDSSSHQLGVHIDPTQVQNLGVRTEKVVQGRLMYAQTVPANLDFNEYEYAIVQSRAEGFVEKTYPLTVGNKITKDTPLIEMTIPQWAVAQSEYLLFEKNQTSTSNIQGARERLRLQGMPDYVIEALKKTQKIQTRLTLKAPIDGVITAFDVRAGMNISKNDVIAKIQGINPIWITAEIPESSAHLIQNQNKFEITLPAFPGQNFVAKTWEILPKVNVETRTVQLRLQVDNSDETLKPGMNALIKLQAESEPMLLIPSQAVIDVGHEQRVITLDKMGRFVPKQIKILRESQAQAAVLSGLNEGDLVVVSGQFLIDSEANISGALDAMRSTSQNEQHVDHANHSGENK